MWKKWLLYGTTLLVFGVLAQQVLTTCYLARIDYGLRSSLSSTKQLSSIESAITQKNQALKGMAQTTTTMNQQLKNTLDVTLAIDANIRQIDDLNGNVLQMNKALEPYGQSSANNLSHIAQQLSTLNQAITQMGGQLSGLGQVLQTDASSLHDMKVQTDEMNAKTPGVTP